MVRDPSGLALTTTFNYSQYGDVTSVQDLSYDRNHRLTLLTDDNFRTTGYEYDGLGRTKKATYADSKYVTYSVRVR